MLLSSGYEAGSPTSVAVDGRSANRLVTAKIKLRSTFTPTSCTSTCRNLVEGRGEEGTVEWEKGKEEEGEGKNGEKKVQGKLQKYSHNTHEQSINHIALEKIGRS